VEWVETTGRTLDEARDAALDMLGVDESDAEFVTLSEPRPGLFGRLRGEARVRARVMPTTPPPKRNRGRRPPQRRGSSGQREEISDGPAVSRPPRSRSANSSSSKSAGQPPLTEEVVAPGDGNDGKASGPGAGKSRSARRRRSRAGAAGARSGGSVDSSSSNGSENGSETEPVTQRKSRQRKPATSETHDEEETVAETLSLEEQGDLAKQFIEGLVAQLGLSATVTARALDDEAVQVAVDGDELGLLVGQGGATLAAIQELTRTVVQRKTGGRTERILVDVAGYRAKRSEALGKFTKKVVDEVVASGREKALESMSPADRKVVHDAVNEIGGASTRSEGEEPNRYVIISPLAQSASADADNEPETDESEIADAETADSETADVEG
jgi:spoIIIJ-associated protein